MGKLLSLGARLKYPITINKLLKNPGDPVKKQEPILQYKFTSVQEVGDPFGEQWEEEQTTIADWDSPADGTIKSWKVREGMAVEKDLEFVEIEEECPHSIQYAGLCGMCGKDMTEVSWASASTDTERANINMIHDHTNLKVSQDEASRAEEELQRRLLKQKKLSLVVDLDQTIIHACIEPTVGEWQNDPTSPNYEAVKDVRSFQLNDDGPRGLASGCWYYIKMRPGLKEFLAKISEIYELHVYTMGTRAYALNIAKIVDPDKKLFGDRIISRDENGNVTAKSLARLFPVDTKMVVIIDDRADVWPNNRPNLIKVVPYDFFLGIGDINSSFLPKREELPKLPPAMKKRLTDKSEENEKEDNSAEKIDDPTKISVKTDESKGTITPIDKPSEEDAGAARISALEELVRMGAGDDQELRQEQAAEQEKFLEKQLTERPLLHMQEELDKEDMDLVVAEDEAKNGDTGHHRHNLLKDDDMELIYLEKHLSNVHKAFYDEYDRALVNVHGGRVAQLKPGHNKKVSLKEDSADLKIVPDIGEVMPRLKYQVLEGCTIVMSGLVPLGVDLMRSEIALQAVSFGADLHPRISRRVTHVVASTSRTRTHKVRQAARYPKIKIVNQQWLLNSMSKWEKEDEAPYLVEIHEQDRKADGDNDFSSVPSSIHASDESADETEESEFENESIPNSQLSLDEDDEELMPGGLSPVDDLKQFDWGEADVELAKFMDSEDSDSDDESIGSDATGSSFRSNLSGILVERKRKHVGGDTTDGEESGEDGKLRKKQKVKGRESGLKVVKTPNSGVLSEASLLTPIGTGDEAGVGGNSGDGDANDEDDELEKEMLAEFEREEREAVAADVDVEGADMG